VIIHTASLPFPMKRDTGEGPDGCMPIVRPGGIMRKGIEMTSVVINQVTSKGSGKNAFLNVNEEYGYINVWGSLYETETYLLFAHGSNEFHLVQFDKDATQAEIAEFFASKRKHYRVVKIEEGGGFTAEQEPIS